MPGAAIKRYYLVDGFTAPAAKTIQKRKRVRVGARRRRMSYKARTKR